MPIRFPVDYARLRNALGEIAESILPGVHVRWSDQDVMRAPLPLLLLNLTIPPAPSHVDEVDAIRLLPKRSRVTFSNVADGRQWLVFVNNWRLSHKATAGDGPEQVRDAVLALVSDSPEPVTASTGPTVADLDIVGDDVGKLRDVRAVSDGGVEVTTIETQRVLETGGTRVGTLSVNCYTRDAVGAETADAIIDAFRTGLSEEHRRSFLRQHGIGIYGDGSRPRNLSDVMGTEREFRVQVDMTIAVQARLSRLAESTIDALEGDGDLDGTTVPINA